MRLPWRRSRPLHEQLMDELEQTGSAPGEVEAGGWAAEPAAGWGFDPSATAPPDVLGQQAPQLPASFHGVPRPRGDWDAVVTAEAPGLEGEEIDFLALEGGDVFIEQALPRGDVAPLADAVEARLAPPYRAHAAHQEGNLWAVSARTIRLARFRASGNEIELTMNQGERTLRVDGRESTEDVPELEAAGSAAGADFHARAIRIDGDLWEVEVAPL